MSAVTAIVTGSRVLTAVKYVSINLLFGFCFPWFQLKKTEMKYRYKKIVSCRFLKKKMIIIERQKRNALQ